MSTKVAVSFSGGGRNPYKTPSEYFQKKKKKKFFFCPISNLELKAEGHKMVGNVVTVVDKEHGQLGDIVYLVGMENWHDGTEQIKHVARGIVQLSGTATRKLDRDVERVFPVYPTGCTLEHSPRVW